MIFRHDLDYEGFIEVESCTLERVHDFKYLYSNENKCRRLNQKPHYTSHRPVILYAVLERRIYGSKKNNITRQYEVGDIVGAILRYRRVTRTGIENENGPEMKTR